MEEEKKEEVSRVNARFVFNKNVWVLSLLNTGSKLGGHAIMVVEGLKFVASGHQIFVGQYDINAISSDEKATLFGFNVKGKIHKIRVFEGGSYSNKKPYSNYSSKSYYISPDQANNVIEAIKKDKKETDQATRDGRLSDLIDYQRLGAEHSLVANNDGHNCSSYLSEKIRLHCEINPDGKKPKKMAGYSCTIS